MQLPYPGDQYLAGLVDGEGSIFIQAANKGGSYHPVLSIGMAVRTLPILESIKDEFGGGIWLSMKADERREETRYWSVVASFADCALKRLLPYLLLKKEQALLALEVEAIRQNLITPGNQKARWTNEAREQCENIRQQIKKLNDKGTTWAWLT